MFSSHKHDDTHGPFSKVGAAQASDVEKVTSEAPKDEVNAGEQSTTTAQTHAAEA